MKKKPGPKRKLTQDQFDKVYAKVVSMVGDGITIKEACMQLKTSGFDDGVFYRYMTLEQKKELRTLQILSHKSPPRKKRGTISGLKFNRNTIEGVALLVDDNSEDDD